MKCMALKQHHKRASVGHGIVKMLLAAYLQSAITLSASADGVIIMDNSDAGFSRVGHWYSSTVIAGYYGNNYVYSAKGDGSSKATWRFDIATSGNFNVDARWSAQASSRATDAPYTLYNNGTLVARVTKNQQINGGQFNPLGSYSLNAGTLEVVLDNNASRYVIADAVRVTSSTITSTATSSSTIGGNTTSSGTSGPVQTGSMTLRWTAPVSRSDGTPLSLSEIDGYRMYYGPSAGNYRNSVDVPDGTVQSATVTDVPVGTYSVVMTTYDVNGLTSGYSPPVTKTAK